MKSKKSYLFYILSFISLTIASCSPPLWFLKDQGGTTYTDRQQLVFTHMWQRGNADYEMINDMIEKFNESEIAEELNVYVRGNGINFWDYWEKVNLSISGGNAPDIFLHAVSSTPLRLSHLLDLTEMYEDDVANGRETLDANEMFFESQINDIARYDENNHMRAWPFSATVRAVYYNKDLFEAAGIEELPTTWSEMEEISKKLTTYKVDGDPSSGYEIVGWDPFMAEGQYIHQRGWLSGHEFWSYDSDGRPVPNFTDPEFIENIEYLVNSYVRKDEESEDLLEDWSADISQRGIDAFVSGKLGMVVNNEGLYLTLREANVDFDYGVFLLPTVDEDTPTVNWSSSYSIELYNNELRSGLSDEVKEQRNRGAWEFLKYLYSEECQGTIYESGFMIANTQYYDEYVYQDPIFTELSKAIESTKEAEYIDAVPNWTSDIQTYVNNIYSDKMTVKEAMESIEALLNDKIEQYYFSSGN